MSTNTHPLSVQPFSAELISAELIFAGPETLNVRAPGAAGNARQLPSTAAAARAVPAFAKQGR